MNTARSWMIGPTALTLATLGFAGCGQPHPLMPLALHQSSTYVARFGLSDQRVEPITVVRELSVANARGFEIAGPLGVSKLGWRDGVLYADQAANAFFAPSLPMLTEDGRPRTWEGRIVTDGVSSPASGRLVQGDKPVKLTIGGHTYTATLATLTLQLPHGAIELESWYQPGVGLVQQEQRTNGQRVTQIQLVTAP